jgi:hypothetical protein
MLKHLLVGLTMSLGAPLALNAQEPSDLELAKGIRQAQTGEFDEAIVTLDAAARRLSAQRGQPRELARAYLYLSIAYLGLAQEQNAKARFMDALKADPDLELTAREFPPRVLQFFADAQRDIARPGQGGGTGGDEQPQAAAAAEGKRKGGSKTLPIVLGAAGAAAGAAALALGGGTATPATAQPTPTPTPTPDPRRTTQVSGTATLTVADDDIFRCPYGAVEYNRGTVPVLVEVGPGPLDISLVISPPAGGYTFSFCAVESTGRWLNVGGGSGGCVDRGGIDTVNCRCVGPGPSAAVTATPTVGGRLQLILFFNCDGPRPTGTVQAGWSATVRHPN